MTSTNDTPAISADELRDALDAVAAAMAQPRRALCRHGERIKLPSLRQWRSIRKHSLHSLSLELGKRGIRISHAGIGGWEQGVGVPPAVVPILATLLEVTEDDLRAQPVKVV